VKSKLQKLTVSTTKITKAQLLHVITIRQLHCHTSPSGLQDLVHLAVCISRMFMPPSLNRLLVLFTMQLISVFEFFLLGDNIVMLITSKLVS